MRLGGIILAAGRSTRMGAFKPLLPLNGRPVLCGEAELFLGLGISPILVVAGSRREEIAQVLAPYRAEVQVIRNPDSQGDMFSSVRVGAAALPRDLDGFFCLPSDCPAVSPHTLRRLADAFQAARPPLCVPFCRGKRGHPPLLAAELREPLLAYGGQGGLKQFLRQYQALEVPIEDPEITRDVDTPEDYRALLRCVQGETRWSGNCG